MSRSARYRPAGSRPFPWRQGIGMAKQRRPPLRLGLRPVRLSPAFVGERKGALHHGRHFLSPIAGERWTAKRDGVGVWRHHMRLPSPLQEAQAVVRRPLRRLALALLTLTLASLPAAAEPPARVMSLNLCTDQLAMALAAPGQLASVSFLAREPALSPMHRQARAYPVNHGRAEEVFLARPDLVVTGTYSLHNTTPLLKRLGFRVEEFSFVQSLDTVPGEIRRMGALLGREERAEALAAGFEAELGDVEAAQCQRPPKALAYDQNGVALGKGTLADSVLAAAGFRNLAAELGVAGMAPFPLELVVEEKPDVVIIPGGGEEEEAPSLGARVPRHPALAALPATRIGAFVPPGTWSCGGPALIEAVKALAVLREEIAPCGETP